MNEDTALARISLAKKALAEAASLSDVLEIRDRATAMQAYANAKGADEAQQMALEIKLRAERKAGQFLKEQPRQEKGRPKKSNNSLHLSDLGVTRMESSRWQKMADVPEEKFEDLVSKSSGVTQSSILKEAERQTKGKPHVAKATGEDEWYTPKKIIRLVKRLMKEIDVDPASSKTANRIIGAKKYYTKEEDGLKQEWKGRVWMNPPYSQPLVTKFCNLFVEKHISGEISEGCVLVNNATETRFYQNMMQHCRAICFVKGRIKFVDANGESTGAPLQGQTILYFGEYVDSFAEVFSELGVVLFHG